MNELSNVTQSDIDLLLSLQLTVAWAGEALSQPKRLGWWRTDLIDAAGGGDLLRRLCPRTYKWAGLEAVRKVALTEDKKRRLSKAEPEHVRTLFYWSFEIDEKVEERLHLHKQSMKSPTEVLSFPVDIEARFDKAVLEKALSLPDGKVRYDIVPGGRELKEVPTSLADQARSLVASMAPFPEEYPAPFFRIKG